MSVKDLRTDASLSKVEAELEHTEANLDADPLTQRMAQDAADKLALVEVTRTAQGAYKRAEVRAQARVNYLNRALDDLTRRLVTLLLAAYGRRDAAGFRRYFGEDAPSTVTRKALESQLSDCAHWPDSLAAEADPALAALAPRFGQVIADARAALDARAAAQQATRAHRLDRIEPLIADLNAYRQRLYAALLDLAAAQGLDKAWPREFFLSPS